MIDTVPLPGPGEWFMDGLLWVLTATWLTHSACAFRTARRRKWISAVSFAAAYAISAGIVVINDHVGDTLKSFHERLTEPAPPVHFESDWGSTFPPANRTEWSRMLARHSYQAWGIHQEYFDLDGRLVQYVPTAEDRIAHERRIAYIAEIAAACRSMEKSALAWLFLPLFSLGLSLLARRTQDSGL